jgi:hypothetical protein
MRPKTGAHLKGIQRRRKGTARQSRNQKRKAGKPENGNRKAGAKNFVKNEEILQTALRRRKEKT